MGILDDLFGQIKKAQKGSIDYVKGQAGNTILGNVIMGSERVFNDFKKHTTKNP